MNDETFDNRGFSPFRTIRGLLVALAVVIIVLPLAGISKAGPFGALLLGVAAASGLVWYRRHRRGKLLERMATTSIAGLRGGYVEISGTVVRADSRELRDPVFKQPCAWFGVETQREERGRVRMWLPFKRAASSRYFRLRDASGSSCLVDPVGAQFALRKMIDMFVNDRVKHRVWRIHEGDVITVVGEAERDGDGWRLCCPEGAKFLVTDAPPGGSDAI